MCLCIHLILKSHHLDSAKQETIPVLQVAAEPIATNTSESEVIVPVVSGTLVAPPVTNLCDEILMNPNPLRVVGAALVDATTAYVAATEIVNWQTMTNAVLNSKTSNWNSAVSDIRE